MSKANCGTCKHWSGQLNKALCYPCDHPLEVQAREKGYSSRARSQTDRCEGWERKA